MREKIKKRSIERERNASISTVWSPPTSIFVFFVFLGDEKEEEGRRLGEKGKRECRCCGLCY